MSTAFTGSTTERKARNRTATVAAITISAIHQKSPYSACWKS